MRNLLVKMYFSNFNVNIILFSFEMDINKFCLIYSYMSIVEMDFKGDH